MSNKNPATAAAAVTEKTAKERRADAKKQKKLEKQHKKEVKRLKKEYDARQKIVPVNKRPIVCPPDRLGESRGKVVAGFLCRAFIIFVAVFAVAFFVCDALGFTADYGIKAGALALWSLLFTAVLTAMCLIRFVWIPGVLVLGAAVLVPLLPYLLKNPIGPFVNIYNAAMLHLSKSYYYDTTGMTVNPAQVQPVVILFILVVAAVYVPCLIRRIHILPPAILSAAILWGVFVYNLSRSNWGVTLLIASFASLLVMFVYDLIYVREPKKDKVDDNVSFFGTEDEPQMPETVRTRAQRRAEKKEAKAAARAAKKEKKRALREHTVTVAEELDDYFAETPKKPKKEKKPKAPKLTRTEKKELAAKKKAEKAAAKQAKREERAAVRNVLQYRARKINAKCAVGGFAGAGMLALVLILMLIPALSVHGRFKTIPSIDKKMEYYRDYVTAWLMGDDPSLDLLAYEGNKANFAPHSAAANPRYYQNIPIMVVDVNTRQFPVYMRGWVGVDYKDGSWYTGIPDDPVFIDYRRLFSTYIDPSETMFSNLFSIMAPGSIDADTDYVKHSRTNSSYGFAVTQVNVLRQDFKSLLLYMPSYSLRGFAVNGKTSAGKTASFLRGYGTDTASKVTFADYFDGMYTSYRASRDTEGYASVAMLTSMKTEGFHRNVADLITGYNLLRYAVNGQCIAAETEPVTIDEVISDELTVPITYTHYVAFSGDDPAKAEFRIEYDVGYNTAAGQTFIRVAQPVGAARYIINENGTMIRKIVDIPDGKVFDEEGYEIIYSAPALNYVIRYHELMTEAEKEALASNYRITDFYTPYVYRYYAGAFDTESAVIRSVLDEIVANAKTSATEEYEVTEPVENPETGEVENVTYTLTRKIEVPADFSRAAEHNVYRVVEEFNKKTQETTCTDVYVSGVLDREVYIQRHEMVMAIVDYLTDPDVFTYTLRPQQTAPEGADPIEFFLTQSHEGYCVQFASALTRLLRAAGIPARYVEGYLASNFVGARGDHVASYTDTVLDSDAHAWVEVWYDGIGWLQYEATPPYYSMMYPVENEPRDPHVNPTGGDEDPGEEDDPGMTDEELAEYIRKMEEEARRAKIRKIITIVCVIAAVLAVIAVFFLIVLTRARAKAKERAALIDKLKRAEETAPTREDVRAASDLINLLMAECGSAPKIGEFREEYTARIFRDYGGAIGAPAKSEKLTEFEAAHSAITENQLGRVFDAIAAEEFGYGAETADLPLMAKFYERVYDNSYSRVVSPVRRVWLWLFRQVL